MADADLFAELPNGWQVKRLADLASLQSGGTPSKQRPDFWQGSIPWASPKDMKRPYLFDAEDHISEEGLADGSRRVPAGSLFIVVRGMILERDIPIALAAVPMAFNQDMKAIIPNGLVDGNFLLFALRQFREQLRRDVGSSAHGTKRIGTSAIEGFLLPLPPLAEQRAIAHVLRAVQRAKEAAEAVVASARQLKRSLLRHLFTYGPVPVAEAGRVPLKETEIGPIPEHWELTTVGAVIAKGPQNGLYRPMTDYGSGSPIVRINDFDNEGSIVRSAPNLVRLSEAEVNTYRLVPDDLLVNRVNSLSHLGKTGLIGELAVPTVFESNMMRFAVDADLARPRCLFHLLNLPAVRDVMRTHAKRAVAQSSINQEDVKSLPLSLPSLAEQDEIVRVISTTDAKIRADEARASALGEVFRSLLRDLMTGRVRVHELGLVPVGGET